MKKVLWILLIASLLSAAEQNRAVRAVENGYQNWGIGGGLSLVVPENGWGKYFANQNVGPGMELKGVVRFKIGHAGEVHYVPSINWWGRWDKWGEEGQYTDVALNDWELNINLFDARYVPPMPKNVPIKPYAGFGLISFSIYHYSEDIGERVYYWNGWEHDYWGGYYNSDTRFKISQNFFVGAEFTPYRSDFWPYVEFRLTSGNVSDFIMTAGFTIQGRK